MTPVQAAFNSSPRDLLRAMSRMDPAELIDTILYADTGLFCGKPRMYRRLIERGRVRVLAWLTPRDGSYMLEPHCLLLRVRWQENPASRKCRRKYLFVRVRNVGGQPRILIQSDGGVVAWEHYTPTTVYHHPVLRLYQRLKTRSARDRQADPDHVRATALAAAGI